jgi:hypothetical protein
VAALDITRPLTWRTPAAYLAGTPCSTNMHQGCGGNTEDQRAEANSLGCQLLKDSAIILL